jgi:hypothetical protein
MGSNFKNQENLKKDRNALLKCWESSLHHVNWLPYLSLRISSFLPKFSIISKTCQTASTEYFKNNNLNLIN